MTKVRCHYCGVEILEDTANRTNGYCMPHSGYGLSFPEKIGGEFKIVSYQTQQQVEYSVTSEHKKEFDIIRTLMLPGDKLVKFTTTPFKNQKEYAKSGYAIYREHKYFTGFVTELERNQDYYQDVETEVNIIEIIEVFGEDWEKIKNELIEGDIVVHCITSPYSWDCLAGRDYYAVKRGDEYLFSKLIRMN